MAVGIVCEYNPFHNGHIYHINKVREMFPNEEIVLVMSSSFTERGEISIIDKWHKTDIALNYVDLVIELPTFYTIQSADIFAYGSISLLNYLNVDKLVFGSESNDISILEKIVDVQNTCEFNNLVKANLNEGKNYPTALSNSIKQLLGFTVNEANDLLGISYLKCIKENHYNIKPYTIKRTNCYNCLESNDSILSATGIREMIRNNEDISKYVPEEVLNLDYVCEDNYFNFLKYKIISSDDLSNIRLVDEGIDNRIKKYIIKASNIQELISLIKTKRYTYNRIYRTLACILCNLRKDDSFDIDYIKILGFNSKGLSYLNSIKKNIELPVITGYNFDSKLLSFEKEVSLIYSLGMKDSCEFLEKENSNKPIIKKSVY